MKDRIAAAATDLTVRLAQNVDRDAECSLTGWAACKQHECIAENTLFKSEAFL